MIRIFNRREPPPAATRESLKGCQLPEEVAQEFVDAANALYRRWLREQQKQNAAPVDSDPPKDACGICCIESGASNE
jgi:hypothetical protein